MLTVATRPPTTSTEPEPKQTTMQKEYPAPSTPRDSASICSLHSCGLPWTAPHSSLCDRSWRGGAGERVRTFVDHPGGVCYKTTTTTTRKRRAGSSTSSQMRATIRTSAKRRDRKSRPLTMDGIPTAGRGDHFYWWAILDGRQWDCFMCEA